MIQKFSRLTGQLNQLYDAIKQYVVRALGIEDPLQILPYRGYGTPHCINFIGRVLQDEGIEPGDTKSSIWKNIANMYR